jgi:hypothetical protein
MLHLVIVVMTRKARVGGMKCIRLEVTLIYSRSRPAPILTAVPLLTRRLPAKTIESVRRAFYLNESTLQYWLSICQSGVRSPASVSGPVLERSVVCSRVGVRGTSPAGSYSCSLAHPTEMRAPIAAAIAARPILDFCVVFFIIRI